MASAMPVDEETLGAALERPAMRKIGQGDKGEVFLLEDGRILKLMFAHHAALAPEEAAIARMLERAGVQAPRAEALIELDGRPGIVFGNLPAGTTLSRVVRAKPWSIVGAAANLAELHAAVHACRSPELASQRARLEQEIAAAEGVSDAAKQAAMQTLSGLPDGDSVCHNDIHMLNVIVHPQGAMIIDWVLATRGNPLADVACAVLQLGFGEQPAGVVARAALELGRAAFWRTYLRRYLQLRGGREELAQWELPIAVALAGRRVGRMRRQLLQRIEALVGARQPGLAAVRS